MPTQLMLPVVVMIRHAQSEWNREGRFTGWADPALTDAGRDEAIRAANEKIIADTLTHRNVLTQFGIAVTGAGDDNKKQTDGTTGQ